MLVKARVEAQGGHVNVVSGHQVGGLRGAGEAVLEQPVHPECDGLIPGSGDVVRRGKPIKGGGESAVVLTQEGGAGPRVHGGPGIPHQQGAVPEVAGVDRGAGVVAPDALEQHLVPLAGHAVVGADDGVIDLFLTVRVGVGRAHVAGIRNAVQVKVRRPAHEFAVVGHDDLVPGAFSAQDVDEAVVVDVQERHVVAVGDPVKGRGAVRVVQGAPVVFIDGHPPAAVARRDVHVHVGYDHVRIPVQVQIGGVHIAPETIGGAESEVDRIEPEAHVGGVGGGGQHLVAAVVHHVEVQQAVVIEVHHLKHVR